MRSALIGVLTIVTGCGGVGGAARTASASGDARGAYALDGARDAQDGRGARDARTSDGDIPQVGGRIGEGDDVKAPRRGAWIGAEVESERLLTGTSETTLGVWVDAPQQAGGRAGDGHVPLDLALVIDTSGSMGGAKIASARAAAQTLVECLGDGDIVSIDTFADEARVLVAPVTLTPGTRGDVLAAIARIGHGGSTNMYAGLTLGESHMESAPPSHTLRRVVMISDGMANVGPSTPAALGALAERGLRARAQVTSLGVGVDYDEHTLNALAVRTSGRLYHLSDPREMVATLRHEIDLLASTVASDAFVDVVPAPGGPLVGAAGIRADAGERGSLRIPLGVLYGGQHREALVRVQVTPSAWDGRVGGPSRPLASVRLRFHDPADGDVERVQEVIARAGYTDDPDAVARSVSPRARAIAAIQSAASLELSASQAVSKGEFGDAEKKLVEAESSLRAQAQATADVHEKRRLEGAATNVGAARASAGAAAAAPRAVQRDEALKMNKAAMDAYGY
jgi:Ca-activated chloride channel family protein